MSIACHRARQRPYVEFGFILNILLNYNLLNVHKCICNIKVGINAGLTDAKISPAQSESTAIIEEKQHRSRALKPEVLREVKSPHSHFSTRAPSCF